ncbi:polyphosphate polymerase domain-containing protein [Candidatus Poriferisocius sp.]|uniref:polyphosphate polymerase domain-containing protein n=1 Tax=Candidatus Poriferisocius sp. TaxID=3101276 RepID=UPI003B01B59A
MKPHPLESTFAEALLNLETVGLDGLTTKAGLQTRKDRKYLVPEAALPALVHELDFGCRVLTIDGRNRFAYRSTYFDTPRLDSYFDAAHRRPSRFKVRTRHYLDTQLCMLEVKTSDSRGLTVKHRMTCDPNEENGLTACGRAFVETIEQTSTVAGDLQPLLTTTYHRTTLLPQVDEAARVTIDTGLLWRGVAAELALGPVAVIETKTTTRPCKFDRLLWRLGHRPTTISKYCTGLAALNPTLAANKWNRVLRHQLNWHPERGHALPASPFPAAVNAPW